MKNYRIALALSLVFALFVPSVWAQEYNSVNVLENSNINNAENVSESNSEDNDDLQPQIVVSETIGQSIDKKEPPIVWFVHGVKFIRWEFKKERRILLKIYPDAEGADSKGVILKKWDSPRLTSKSKWRKARNRADIYSQALADEIVALPKEKQERLILAGHSLGGRIVVRTAAKLKEYNNSKPENEKIRIKKIILAGAAIDNDDKDIPSTWEVSEERVENLINTQDFALAFYCWLGEKHAALGTGYKSKDFPEDRFHEIPVNKSLSHSSYLKVYKKLLDCIDVENEDYIVVPQVRPNWNWKTMNRHTWWDVVDECYGWELQKHIGTYRYRIVDNNNVRRAWGHWVDDKEVFEVFDIVKYRLVKWVEKHGKFQNPEKWWLLITPIQDEFNIHTKKNAQSNKWEDLETFEYKGKVWRLQITKKSKGKGPKNEQMASDYRLKKEAFYQAKSDYFAKKYEYKALRKWWSRVREKDPDEEMNEKLDKEFDEELDKELNEDLEKAFDDELDKGTKEELKNELKKELDEDLNYEVDVSINGFTKGLNKEQCKAECDKLDKEYDLKEKQLEKEYKIKMNQLKAQKRNYHKDQYKALIKKMKEDYDLKKDQLKKARKYYKKQLKNELDTYKALCENLKEKYNNKKNKLRKELKDLKDKMKAKEKEFKKVKEYDETECRILDPENRLRAKGNETNMRKSFDDLKERIKKRF